MGARGNTKINYDILSIVFILTIIDWERGPLVLSWVCRLWRLAALNMPQLWCRITPNIASNPELLAMFLSRSGTIHLHVGVPRFPSRELTKLFPSIVNRIVCMRVSESAQFLDNDFVALEKLELLSANPLLGERPYLPSISRFPRLRDLSLLESSHLILRPISLQTSNFPPLQALGLRCETQSFWRSILQNVSRCLISLHLLFRDGWETFELPGKVSLPQLRYLRITNPVASERSTFLHLDAPRLEYVHESYWLSTRCSAKILLTNPDTVKELSTCASLLTLAPYPGLRKLWLLGEKIIDIQLMFESLESEIQFCPGLEAIFYSSRWGDWDAWGKQEFRIEENLDLVIYDEAPYRIWDIVQRAGRKIQVWTFRASDLSLPGSLPPRVCFYFSPFRSESYRDTDGMHKPGLLSVKRAKADDGGICWTG